MVRQGDVDSLESALRYIRRLHDNPDQQPWAVGNLGRLVGLVCITVDRINRNGWFWYWMAPVARGKGWMKRAAATAADAALERGVLERLELGHRVNNPASGSVARAAGFVKEGTERGKFLIGEERVDVDTYARLLSDPYPVYLPLARIERTVNVAMINRGRLLCADEEEAAIVRQHLARHVELTRQEAGCLLFEVTETADPLVWQVEEEFASPEWFTRHQERTAASEWGRATAGITRDYTTDVLRD
jgi:RimJ/RimL family protein N-acetyltransferase/quinol monooxygenase YgiN